MQQLVDKLSEREDVMDEIMATEDAIRIIRGRMWEVARGSYTVYQILYHAQQHLEKRLSMLLGR
jgi:hypothetical protein